MSVNLEFVRVKRLCSRLQLEELKQFTEMQESMEILKLHYGRCRYFTYKVKTIINILGFAYHSHSKGVDPENLDKNTDISRKLD